MDDVFAVIALALYCVCIANALFLIYRRIFNICFKQNGKGGDS